MARNPSAEKRNRQNEVLRERNRGYRSRMRSGVKKLRTLVESGDSEAARAALPGTLGLIERTAQKGVIHRNTADRYKSRLTKLVRGAAAERAE
jgi:small subunit ribosomal protein S20